MRWMPCSRPQISSLHNLIGGGAFPRIKSKYLPVVPKVSRNSFITNSNTCLDIPVRYPRGRLLIVDVIFYWTIRLYAMRCKCGETVPSYHGSVVLGRMDGCNDCLCVADTLYGARDLNLCSNVQNSRHPCKTVEAYG